MFPRTRPSASGAWGKNNTPTRERRTRTPDGHPSKRQCALPRRSRGVAREADGGVTRGTRRPSPRRTTYMPGARIRARAAPRAPAGPHTARGSGADAVPHVGRALLGRGAAARVPRGSRRAPPRGPPPPRDRPPRRRARSTTGATTTPPSASASRPRDGAGTAFRTRGRGGAASDDHRCEAAAPRPLPPSADHPRNARRGARRAERRRRGARTRVDVVRLCPVVLCDAPSICGEAGALRRRGRETSAVSWRPSAA